MKLGIRGLMEDDEVERLYQLALSIPPDLEIVEIGTHTGLSTCYLAKGCQNGRGAHVTAIDPYPAPRPESRDDPFELGPEGVMAEFHANLTRLRLWPFVTPLRAYAGDIAKVWTKPIGLLFVDAVHEYKHVAADFEAWTPFVQPRGWIAFHDYNATDYPGVVEALDQLAGESWAVDHQIGSLWTAQRR